MNKILLIALLSLFAGSFLSAQSRLIDRAGQIKFYSEASMENIEANTNQGLAVIDTQSGKVAVSLLMKSFHFKKALMQEHFNENYIESDKYPKATFSGEFGEKIDFDKVGKSTLLAKGELSLHGEKNLIEAMVTFDITDTEIRVTTTFMATVADYKIKIPKLVVDNIAKEVEVTANFKFQKAN